MSEYIIRPVREEDAKRLTEIYAYYVENTAVSFEYTAPDEQEFIRRIKETTKVYPYLVYEKDGLVLGYAYAGRYASRAAYDWTVSSSIYIDKEHRCGGIGRALYAELEDRLRAMGMKSIIAGIAYLEKEDEYLKNDSVYFHEKVGYERVAQVKAAGKKFGRWYDLVLSQKML